MGKGLTTNLQQFVCLFNAVDNKDCIFEDDLITPLIHHPLHEQERQNSILRPKWLRPAK